MAEKESGYILDQTKIITTPFADDFNLITRHKNRHQRLIKMIHNCAKTMNLKLKPSKCRSLSISSGKSSAVSFYIENDVISTLDQEPHKFLGSTITFSGKQKDVLSTVKDHFAIKLKLIDDLLVRGEYKIKMYRDYLQPACRFLLTVHELTISSLKSLDALCNRYLKKWSGIAHSANPHILHVNHTVGLKSIEELYHLSQTSAFISSKMKADGTVQAALNSVMCELHIA